MKAIFRRSKAPQVSLPPTSSSMASHNTAQVADTSLKSDPPTVGKWDSAHTTIGAGVAIFHLASSRVVLCYHSVDNYWFLPKGRRDTSEDTGAGAEREGFEEVQGSLRIQPSVA